MTTEERGHHAELVVVKGENRGAFVKVNGSFTIGRSSKADFTIEDTKASSVHVRITPLPSGIILLEDLDSTNGTFVNKEQIEQIPLRSGDLIKIGRTLLVFRDEPAEVRLEDIALVGGGSSNSIRSARCPSTSVGARRRSQAPASRGSEKWVRKSSIVSARRTISSIEAS